MEELEDSEKSDSYLGEMTSKISFVFVAGLSSAVLGYIALMIANRFIGSESYGMVAFSLSFAGLFFFVSDLGFSQAHIKRISEGGDERLLMPTFIIIKLILTGLMALIVFAAFWIWELLGGGYENPETKSLTLIVFSYYVLFSIGTIFVATYNAKRDAIRSQSAVLSEILFRCIATIAVAVLGWGTIGLSATWMVAGVAFFAVAIAVYRGPKLKFPTRAQFRSVFGSYFHFALPLSIFLGFSAGSIYADKIIIQYFFDAKQVALFFGSQRMLTFFAAMASAISVMLFPFLSGIGNNLSTERISRLASRSIHYISLVILPLASFSFVLAPSILGIFISSDYFAAADAFRILTVASVLSILGAPYSSLLLALGKSGTLARLGIVAAVIVIVSDLILIPPESFISICQGMGIVGAAYSLLFAAIFSFSLLSFVIWRETKMKLPKSLPAVALLSVGVSTLLFAIYFVFDATRFYDVIAYFFIQIGLFFPIALFCKILSKDELMRLIRIFLPKNFMKFLRS